jgi:hypothetical protein
MGVLRYALNLGRTLGMSGLCWRRGDKPHRGLALDEDNIVSYIWRHTNGLEVEEERDVCFRNEGFWKSKL